MVKTLPAAQEPQETWVRSLGQEVPLEEGMATQSSILAWRIPWTKGLVGYMDCSYMDCWAAVHGVAGLDAAEHAHSLLPFMTCLMPCQLLPLLE